MRILTIMLTVMTGLIFATNSWATTKCDAIVTSTITHMKVPYGSFTPKYEREQRDENAIQRVVYYLFPDPDTDYMKLIEAKALAANLLGFARNVPKPLLDFPSVRNTAQAICKYYYDKNGW